MKKNKFEEKIGNLIHVTNFKRADPKNYSFEEIGPYLNFVRVKNSDLEISLEQGVNIKKEFITPQRSNSDLAGRIKVRTGQFVYCTQLNNENVAIAYREGPDCVVSPVYEVFEIKDDCKDKLLPHYLLLWLMSPEFGRYVYWTSSGSAYEFLRFENVYTYQIIIPSPEEQQKVVNAWKACREIKEQNEAKAAPLMQLCQSYIQELKHKYPTQEIGPYIHRIDERNTDNSIKEVRSVSVTKDFNETNAKVDKNNLGSYKIVRDSQISFVQTTGNEKCLCAAINHLGFPIVVTSVNEVFETDENYLIADYLHMIFRRKETDRYARFHSWGSARETFTWEDMKRFSIPLPPIDVQRAIVNIYKCANEAKQIAEEADKLSRAVCPALLQHIIHS